jgi:hypothetical protein
MLLDSSSCVASGSHSGTPSEDSRFRPLDQLSHISWPLFTLGSRLDQTGESNVVSRSAVPRVHSPKAEGCLPAVIYTGIAVPRTASAQHRRNCSAGRAVEPKGQDATFQPLRLLSAKRKWNLKGKLKGPKKYSRTELARVGVEAVDSSNPKLRCMGCGQTWSLNIQTGGRMSNGYWRCPNRCNVFDKIRVPVSI